VAERSARHWEFREYHVSLMEPESSYLPTRWKHRSGFIPYKYFRKFPRKFDRFVKWSLEDIRKTHCCSAPSVHFSAISKQISKLFYRTRAWKQTPAFSCPKITESVISWFISSCSSSFELNFSMIGTKEILEHARSDLLRVIPARNITPLVRGMQRQSWKHRCKGLIIAS